MSFCLTKLLNIHLYNAMIFIKPSPQGHHVLMKQAKILSLLDLHFPLWSCMVLLNEVVSHLTGKYGIYKILFVVYVECFPHHAAQ